MFVLKILKIDINQGVVNPRYTFRLENKSYDLELKYNTRQYSVNSNSDDSKSVDEFNFILKRSGSNDIIVSTIARTNRPLLVRSRYKEDCPVGEFYFIDTSAVSSRAVIGAEGADQERLSFEGLGGRFELWYVTND